MKSIELLMHYVLGKPTDKLDLNSNQDIQLNIPKIIFTEA